MDDGRNDPELVAEWQAELDEIDDQIRRLRHKVRNATPSGQWQGRTLAYLQEELRQELIARNIWTALKEKP